MVHQLPQTRDQSWGYRAWGYVASVTLAGTAASFAFSLLLNYLLLFSETLTPFARSMITAVVLPIVIGAPLSLLLGYCLLKIRRQRRELTHSASHDQVTALFSGSAFSSIVNRRAASTSKGGPQQGAFLVVNAENLNAINARYGFGWGDEALRLISSTIRAAIRSGDIVGRLGASEFGIFLPGATEENARDVGERIRTSLARVYFAPTTEGEQELLSVSVGGVIFESEVEFETMYRAAEQQLLNVQNRDDMRISHLDLSATQTDH